MTVINIPFRSKICTKADSEENGSYLFKIIFKINFTVKVYGEGNIIFEENYFWS